MNEHTGTQKGTDIYPDVVHVNIGGLKRTGGACVLNSSSVNRLHGSNWLDGFLALSVLRNSIIPERTLHVSTSVSQELSKNQLQVLNGLRWSCGALVIGFRSLDPTNGMASKPKSDGLQATNAHRPPSYSILSSLRILSFLDTKIHASLLLLEWSDYGSNLVRFASATPKMQDETRHTRQTNVIS